MIAIVHSIYSQSVHAPASHARLMDNEAERYCMCYHSLCDMFGDYNNDLTMGVRYRKVLYAEGLIK